MSTSTPLSNDPRGSHSKASARNIFEDPAISEAAKHDVFIRFVSKHWRSAGLTLVVLAAAVAAYQIVTATALQKRAQATAIVSDIQEAYRSLVSQHDERAKIELDLSAASDEKIKQDLTSKIEASTKDLEKSREQLNRMIASLESPKPFDTLANLYRGLVAVRFNDFDTAHAMLTTSSWEQVGSPNSPDRAVSEVVAFGLSKALLQSEKHKVAGKESLRRLAEQGSFVAVDAARVLAQFATTTEDKAALNAIIEDLKKRFPTLTQTLIEISADMPNS